MTDTDNAATPPAFDATYLARLRRLSFVEGVSTVVLFFVAVPLKYLAGLPIAVKIVGPIHGLLFVALAAALVMATERIGLSRRMAGLGVLAAVIPFGPFVYDRWLAEAAPAAAAGPDA